MFDYVTTLYVKNIDTEKFKKWFEKETGGHPFYDSVDGWDLYIEITDGYYGIFWESCALKMAQKFKEIVFNGTCQIIFDDHIIGTTFACNGKEVTLERYIQLPFDEDEIEDEYKEELENMRSFWELENDIPYSVTLSVEEIISCSKIYKVVEKNLNDNELVESTCAKHKISKTRFSEFANIWDFKKRDCFDEDEFFSDIDEYQECETIDDFSCETFDALLDRFREKTSEDISELANAALQSISLMAMVSGGDDAAMMVIGVVSSCIKIGCGEIPSESKKESIISISPDFIQELMQTQSDFFFDEPTETTYELLNSILASFSVIEDSIFDLLLAMAYIGNEVNENAVEMIREIYTSHKSDN